MSDVILQGLLITAIGMGLVFAVIIFLWWMMGLLVQLTTPKAPEMAEHAGADDDGAENLVFGMADIEKQRRATAAAVAVGLGLAQSRTRPVAGEGEAPIGAMSPWQSVHRARQLGQQHK